MEESSEKRRERLRALREEASLESNGEGRGGPCVPIPDRSVLPLPGDLLQPASASPSPRFEFYTDPLAAFSGSYKKKPKNSLGSPFSGSTAPPPSRSPSSPFWQPDFSNLNPSMRPPGNSYPNVPPPGSFSTPGSSNPNPNTYHFSTKFHPGSFSSPSSYPNHNSYSSSDQASVPCKFTPPGNVGTPRSVDFNPIATPQGGYSNPGPSTHGPRSGFGSPQALPASQMYNGSGSGGFPMNTPASYQHNHGWGGFSTDSPPQHRMGSMNDLRNNGWSQSGMNGGRSQGSNRSRGSFMQSPGSTGREGRTAGRSGGRAFERSSNDASARTNPELFAKRSMLLDPWKDLVPVRFESVAFRLNACSVTDSQDWLPKSVSKGTGSPNMKGVTVLASGPSLAESLAASYTDAVLGEEDGLVFCSYQS